MIPSPNGQAKLRRLVVVHECSVIAYLIRYQTNKIQVKNSGQIVDLWAVVVVRLDDCVQSFVAFFVCVSDVNQKAETDSNLKTKLFYSSISQNKACFVGL